MNNYNFGNILKKAMQDYVILFLRGDVCVFIWCVFALDQNNAIEKGKKMADRSGVNYDTIKVYLADMHRERSEDNE